MGSREHTLVFQIDYPDDPLQGKQKGDLETQLQITPGVLQRSLVLPEFASVNRFVPPLSAAQQLVPAGLFKPDKQNNMVSDHVLSMGTT